MPVNARVRNVKSLCVLFRMTASFFDECADIGNLSNGKVTNILRQNAECRMTNDTC